MQHERGTILILYRYIGVVSSYTTISLSSLHPLFPEFVGLPLVRKGLLYLILPVLLGCTCVLGSQGCRFNMVSLYSRGLI